MKSFAIYKRMLGYLRPWLGLFVVSGIAAVFIVSLDALSLWISATMLSTLFHKAQIALIKPEFNFSNANELLKYYTYQIIKSDTPMGSLKIACILMISTFTLKNVLVYGQSLLNQLLNLKVVRKMRNDLYNHSMALPVSYYDRNKSGGIVSLILNDISMINASMTNTLNSLLIEPIRLVTFVVILLVISPKLSGIIFLVYPFFIWLILLLGKTVRRRSTRMLENFSGLISVLYETLNGIRAVKMFNTNHKESRKFADENTKFINNTFRSSKIDSLSAPLTESLGVLITVILLWYGGKQVLSGHGFDAEDFVRYLIILVSSYQPFKKLAKVNTTLQQGIAAAQRVFALLDTRPEKLNTLSLKEVPCFEKEIRFNKVCFTYPECKDEVLHDIELTIRKGSAVALVGSSGSGKSTILDLLPRFYDVTKGTVTIDGIDVRENDLVGLRHLFGIVSQETILFDETIANNIAYGLEGASLEKIHEAARAANALEFIQELPKEMNTIIGEKGVMLSGGQRQRIAIARALLRNPPVLILDEATSSLDTESERLVQNAIDTLMAQRTVLVVAHRLSTILHADHIAVLEAGRIIEQGTHEHLLALNGRYKYLYDIQFAPDAA